MIKDFIFQNPVRVYFGQDQLQHLREEIEQYGQRVLLVYGGESIKKIGLYQKITKALEGLQVFELPGIQPNPLVEKVRYGANMCKTHKVDVVLAVGGGSTIDASKWIAAGACADCDVWNFFSTDDTPKKALPLISVLTLAATGSEMNMGGVISNPDTKQKLGRTSPLLYPKASFLDPTVTYSVGKYQTACGSADILSHIIETYFNTGSSMYLLDSFMEGMMKTVIRYAPIAMQQPDNYEARANLMWCSSWAINGFAWSCHAMEHELSAFYDITHGLGLAILTPHWMEYCLKEENMDRYVKFATNVFGIDPTLPKEQLAKAGIKALADFLYNTLGLSSTLTQIKIDDTEFDTMAKKACAGGVINGFVPLTPEDVKAIYTKCL